MSAGFPVYRTDTGSDVLPGLVEPDPAPNRSVRDVIPDDNRIEWDYGRLKARLRPMRWLRTDRTASTVIRGHGFMQNLRRGHYEFGVEARHERRRVAAAFDERALAIWLTSDRLTPSCPTIGQRDRAPCCASRPLWRCAS